MPYFCPKLQKMSQKLSSAAVVIGALRKGSKKGANVHEEVLAFVFYNKSDSRVRGLKLIKSFLCPL